MRQRSENSGTFLNEATRSLILFVAPQLAPPTSDGYRDWMDRHPRGRAVWETARYGAPLPRN